MPKQITRNTIWKTHVPDGAELDRIANKYDLHEKPTAFEVMALIHWLDGEKVNLEEKNERYETALKLLLEAVDFE